MSESLKDLGVPSRDGQYRVLCPGFGGCSGSAARAKRSERCLSVKVSGDSFAYYCWHCGESGGDPGIDARGGGMGRKSRDLDTDFGTTRRKLRYGLLSQPGKNL